MSGADAGPELLSCPLCGERVLATRSRCLGCHLPIRDVARHQVTPDQRRRARARAARRRLTGAVLYTALVATTAALRPELLWFVVPAAVGALALHVWKGWSLVGLAFFVLVAGGLPALVAPSLVDDVVGNLSARLHLS